VARREIGCLLASLGVWAATAEAGRIIYVDDDAPGADDGTSWCDAYRFLQDAISEAEFTEDVTEIRVAAGVYRPDAGAGQIAGDREASFWIIGRASLKGGYAGCGAQNPDHRSLRTNQTILSGDLLADDASGDSDCCRPRAERGCDDVVCRQAVCSRVEECCAAAWTDECAAWARLLCCETCGHACDNSRHVVSVSLMSDEPIVLDGFTIRGGNADGQSGGGLQVPFEDYWALTVSRCIFENNLADYGGAVRVRNGVEVAFVNCVFRDNVAGYGGAIYTYEPTIRLVNCLIADNFAAIAGGGYFWEEAFLNWEVTNCTVVRNSAPIGGGLYSSNRVYDDHRGIANTIMWNNRARIGPQIALETRSDRGDSLTLTNCILEGGPAAAYTTDGYELIWDASSNAADPLFVNALGSDGLPATADDDFRIQGPSPAVDAGDNFAVPPDLAADLAGMSRFLDHPQAPDIGIGDPPLVDVGAYECCFADLSSLAAYTGCQAGPGVCATESCRNLDLDDSRSVDLADFAAFQRIFCGRLSGATEASVP